MPLTASTWQRDLSRAITRPEELIDALGLDRELLRGARAANDAFALRVTPSYLARMRRGDRDDPLLRQVLPLGEELIEQGGYVADPLRERDYSRAPNLLQKYAGRALLITTQACAIHCRYCFRRHFPYAEDTAARDGWRDALDTIRRDDSIDEVILSGGDPLSLATAKLAEFTDALAGIAHVRRLRIHSRLPVVLPERIDAELLRWLGALPWPVAVVIHANHANEFDSPVDAALARLRDSGATLLNQAVLLHGVNDSVDALAMLSERAYTAGVLPYYLHQLDRVAGVAHFEVADATALALHADLRARLPGYLVPRLVREIPGDTGKRPLVE
jgi:EF-P beta-lysylation protein EpmB